MKKAPKLSYQKIADLSKTPSFWESFRYTFGSYSKAGKKLKIDPKILSKLGAPRSRFVRPPSVSDTTLDKLQKAIKRMDKRDYRAAREFVYVPGREEFIKGASKAMTGGQRLYALKYARRGSKQAAYFRKAVHDFYIGKTKVVRMGAVSKTGKIYNPGAEKYHKVQKLAKRQRKSAVKIASKRAKAFRRAGRRGHQ